MILEKSDNQLPGSVRQLVTLNVNMCVAAIRS